MKVLYNPPQPMIFRMQFLLVVAVLALALPGAQAASWEQPVAALAKQIAALTGPGPVQLTLRNHSTLSSDEVPQIQQMLEQDLRSLGVVQGGDSTTLVRVTLSQNSHGGLWVAEVQEGTEIRVTMLPVKLDASTAEASGPTLTLRHTEMIAEPERVLDAQIFSSEGEQRLIVLESWQVVVYARKMGTHNSTEGAAAPVQSSPWKEEQRLSIPYIANFSRDMRGRIVAAQDHLFNAYLPGVMCRGADNGSEITLACAGSDDPWPATPTQKAFYDSARNYFIGVLAPGFGMRLAPFYQAAEITRAGGAAILLDNVDGSVVLVQKNQTVPVNGTNDWGSDLAAIHSTCGPGTLALVSGSGAARGSDSLRAYEISGREAVPASMPLQVPGGVTAIWPSISGGNAVVVFQKPDSDEYEVWRVAASCD